jgi:hypothetical protein
MATSSFDKRFRLNKEEAARLYELLKESKPPRKINKTEPISNEALTKLTELMKKS